MSNENQNNDMEVENIPSEKSNEKVSAIKLEDIENNLIYISRGVELNQPRLIQKAIRQNYSIRKFITPSQLEAVITRNIPKDFHSYGTMISYIPLLMQAGSYNETKSSEADMEVEDEKLQEANTHQTPVIVLPEVEVYIFNLLLTTLMKYNLVNEAAEAASSCIERIKTFNRRSMDALSSKTYFYYSLSFEKLDKLDLIRSNLLKLYRTCCIRHDENGESVLLNLLLRNFLHYNLVEQAHILSLRAPFPENASNNQFCRYLYYMGRIQAIQLEYSESYQRLLMASRKAPQGTANGFSLIVHKLMILVQLLMGDIPERSLFNQKLLRGPLQPYYDLTIAVRNGDLIQFNNVVSKYSNEFQTDKNYSLVQRLGHNVLKTGLRKISVSYSRISLKDIADKLHLPSVTAAEYICAKAIQDGVIEAKIDHENSWVMSHEVLDLYSTEEPQRAFHKRIAFCLDVHNEAVKSMRYPPDEAYKKELRKQYGDDKKREDKNDEKTIEELIKEMEDDYDE